MILGVIVVGEIGVGLRVVVEQQSGVKVILAGTKTL